MGYMENIETFRVPELPYPYDAFEGIISSEIMELHHSKHHQSYVDRLNEALVNYPELRSKSVEDLLIGLNTSLGDIPTAIRTSIRNNGGGHYNHSLFWQWMSPRSSDDDSVPRPSGALYDAITARYGSFEAFISEFTTKATSLFGSGWVWLQPNMDIVTTENQDSLLSQGQPAPILGLDVWEHAYYLDYKNRRNEYIENWWKIVNWQTAEQRYNNLSGV